MNQKLNPDLSSALDHWYSRILRRRLTYVAIAAILLLIEYASGVLIMFPIPFVIPVILASWFCAPYIGYIFAVGMTVIKLSFNFFWNNQLALEPEIINAVIMVIVLLFIAYITGRAVRLTHEARLLHGILPICSFCKKICDRNGKWHPIETYIEMHSNANFSHGICPECAKRQYGDVLDKTSKASSSQNP